MGYVGVAAEPAARRLDCPPGHAGRGCPPTAKPRCAAGEPTTSFRHHRFHLRSLPAVPMVEGRRSWARSPSRASPAGVRDDGLAERLHVDPFPVIDEGAGYSYSSGSPILSRVGAGCIAHTPHAPTASRWRPTTPCMQEAEPVGLGPALGHLGQAPCPAGPLTLVRMGGLRRAAPLRCSERAGS